MWRIFGILILASLASSKPARNDRAFSLFSVVTFKNEECRTQMKEEMNGICQTNEECDQNGGTVSGNCASGFGVCCFYSADKCESSSEVTQNITYIQNPNFPTAFTTASQTCGYSIRPNGANDICQIRLDFNNGVLADPGGTGDCPTDTLTVTSPSASRFKFQNLCGTLTDQHMYIETARSSPAATLTITTGAVTSDRTWKIKVSMIECDNPNRAPNDCLQYFTDTIGRFKSFNFGGTVIKNQQYEVCVRENSGRCGLEVTTATTAATPDAFKLNGEAAKGEVGSDCDESYIQIENEQAASLQRHCGMFLNENHNSLADGTVRDTAKPFRVGFVATDAAQTGTGFDLIYRQVPCLS